MSLAIVRRNDADVLADVRLALAGSDAPVSATIAEGAVILSGNAATAAQAEAICGRVRRVPGVRHVLDRIANDDSLLAALQPELAGDGHGCTPRKVHVVLGTVYVDWKAREDRCERLVRDRLLAIPGVRAVVHGTWSKSR